MEIQVVYKAVRKNHGRYVSLLELGKGVEVEYSPGYWTYADHGPLFVFTDRDFAEREIRNCGTGYAVYESYAALLSDSCPFVIGVASLGNYDKKLIESFWTKIDTVYPSDFVYPPKKTALALAVCIGVPLEAPDFERIKLLFQKFSVVTQLST